MVLLIDNYDSFSYNLVQLIGSLVDDEIKVIRNDELTPEQIEALRPGHIILSPGPGRPQDAGVCEAVIRRMQGKAPILGVCLGHQAICEVFGAEITYAAKLMHGKQSVVSVDTDCPVFAGLPERVAVARYHSLAADRNTMPDTLQVIARDDSGEIMAVRHRSEPIFGFQFHPESVLTPNGKQMVENFFRVK